MKKKVGYMNQPFSCDKCKTMMFMGNLRTAINTGKDIKFRCLKCEPILNKDKKIIHFINA